MDQKNGSCVVQRANFNEKALNVFNERIQRSTKSLHSKRNFRKSMSYEKDNPRQHKKDYQKSSE